MPSTALDFRHVCGSFVPVFVAFMWKRAKGKAAMRVSVFTLRNRTDGAVFGLLLCYLFWGSLLQQCGDVELNPGPPKQNNMRQTRLASGGHSVSAERVDTTQNSAPSTLKN